MPKAKYDHIYKDLKEKIETEFYGYQQMLPSENEFVKEYGCSRNTVRRAIAELTADGYVQPMHGKGGRKDRETDRISERDASVLYPASAFAGWNAADPGS